MPNQNKPAEQLGLLYIRMLNTEALRRQQQQQASQLIAQIEQEKQCQKPKDAPSAKPTKQE